MFDEKEIEELYDEFLSLDGNVFLESHEDVGKLDDETLAGSDLNRNLFKNLSHLKNNNFLPDTTGVYLDDPDSNIHLDLINENSITLRTFECLKNSENTTNLSESGRSLEKPNGSFPPFDKKESEVDNEHKEIDEKLSSPDGGPVGKNYFQRNGWPPDSLGLWRSGPTSLNVDQPCNYFAPHQDLTSSVTYSSNEPQSFNTFLSSSKRIYSHQQLGAKVEMVYSLLSMLDMNNREDMSKTFLAMSSSPESCHAMRQSGCLPLLIQLIHSSELNSDVRERAAEALHNIVHSQTDEKRRKREVRVLKLLQQLREYCNELKNNCPQEAQLQEPEKHPINAIGTLMKFSFDAEHRQAICILGGLHAISELIQIDYEVHGSATGESPCTTLRRYAGMSLTNLTFGDCKNKALLCSFNKFMCALVDQLKSPCEDLRQVTASVLRNLSWRADSESKQALRDVGAVTALTVSAMEAKKESTLKSILSALWNLSAHCSSNKIDICSVPGSLAFLVRMLKYKSSSNTLAIIENAGGILRNISSHVAVREDYRQILRENNCFEILLEQLKSPSLTVVSNACGTLWNLSARCAEDQRRLWEMGATTMLRSLVQSKHKMISMGSSAALKNLLAANPNENLLTHLDSTAKNLGLQNLPTLFVRKKRALEQELNITLAETCENIDSIESPTHLTNDKTESRKENTPRRSESRDSVQSTQSDSTYERLNQISIKNEEKLLESKHVTMHESLDEKSIPRRVEEQKLIRRYKSSMIPTPTFKKVNQDRINEKTKEENTQEEAVLKTDFKEIPNRNGTPTLNARTERLEVRNYETSDRCSSLNASQSYDDCLVKYKEIDSSEAEGTRNNRRSLQTGYSCFTPKVLDENLNEKRVFEGPQANDDPPNSVGEQHKISRHVKGNENLSGDANTKVPLRKSLQKEVPPKADVLPQHCISSDDCNNIIREDLTAAVNSALPGARGSSKASQDVTQSKKPVKQSQSDFSSQKFAANKESNESKDVLPNTEMCFLENRYETYGDVSSGSQPMSSLMVEDREPQEEKLTHVVSDSATADARESSSAYSSVDSNTTADTESTMNSGDGSETNSIGNVDGVQSKTLSNVVLPKFKVGSPITDSKALQMEANKICREIKKHQDFEMGCSLTSEVSLISCSSFIDTGDYSLFDSSTDAVDFDDLDFGKVSSKLKNLPLRYPATCQNVESVSLPSLGSLKNETMEALDLDNSILSVASITSEIAETYSKDFDPYQTYTKTCKADARNEVLEDATLADATLVSNDDDTLNADSLEQNNPGLFDEDNSLHCQENLPLDAEVSEESRTDRMKKKLTPKEKRKTFHERYRTYTIRDINGCRSTEMAPALNCQGPNVNLNKTETPANCSASQQCLDNGFNPVLKNEGRQKVDPPSRLTYGDGSCETYLFSKQIAKSQDPKCVSDLLEIGPAERKELVDNAKLVAFTLKTAVQDCEIISDSEMEDPHVDFDTATYSKNYATQYHDSYSSQGLHCLQPYEGSAEEEEEGKEGEEEEEADEEEVEDEEEEEKKGARIIKPSEKSDAKLEELRKGIRGRRKPLYSSPQKRSLRANVSPTNVSRITEPVIEAKRSLSDTGVPPTLNREGTFTKENGPALKKSEVKNSRTIPVYRQHLELKNHPGVRPASGNKSLLPTGNPKRVGDGSVSKIGRPQSTYASKAIEKRSESESSQRRSFSAEAGNRAGGDCAGTKKPTSTALTSPKLRNSSSNHNVKTGNSPGGNGSVKSRNQSLQNSKSQSDASLNLVASKDKGKQKTPKKEVTSKIASLWRKVEETKQKNKTAKDNRVWISADKNSGGLADEVLVVEQEEILDIPTRRILHSVTCQALSDEVSADVGCQERNSRGLHESTTRYRGGDGRSEKIERRNVISAVVPPYNYSPPVAEKTAPLKLKQVDTFNKGSLKITTV